MQRVTKQAQMVSEMAAQVDGRGMRSLFCSKDGRDVVAAYLKQRGYKVKKGSSRNQQIHPEYITDFVGTYETGFGNTDYQRSFAVLYSLEVVAKPEPHTNPYDAGEAQQPEAGYYPTR